MEILELFEYFFSRKNDGYIGKFLSFFFSLSLIFLLFSPHYETNVHIHLFDLCHPLHA